MRAMLTCCCLALLAGCGSEGEPGGSRNAAAANGGAEAAAASPDPGGVDLAVFVIDTLRADQVGAYGNPDGVTPNLDRLARRSVLFTRAYAQSSWTKTSVASLFTGLYPVKHQVFDEETLPRGFLPGQFLTLAELLQQHGYHTCAVSANPHIRSDNGFGQGFDRFEVPGKAWRGNSAGETTELTLAALEEIASRESNFFLYVHFLDPHDPWIKDEGCAQIMNGSRAEDAHVWRGNGFVLSGEADVVNAGEEKTRSPRPRQLSASDREYVRRLYACETHRVDTSVGRVLDRMEELGLLDSAVVVVTADHGEEFWEHGMLLHGYQLFEETVRVPLIIRSPLLDRQQAVVADPVALVDIYATMADLVGADLEAAGAEPVDGAVLPWAEDPQSMRGGRVVYGETRFRNQNKAYAVEDRWKVIVDNNTREHWLFDLEADGLESAPLQVTGHADAMRMKAGLARLRDTESRYDWRGRAEAPRTPDDETVDRLRSLGYVE